VKRIEIYSKQGFYGSIAGLIACVFVAWWMMQPRTPRLTIYCAHDSIHAKETLEAFRKQTKIKFNVKYDTEATKSLGLVELILMEKDNPRCDVFWNNEVLGTIHLQSEGILEPYISPRHAEIPEQFKDPTGYWTGFGARLRVYIVDPARLQPDLAAIDKRLQDPDLSEVTLAKPLYGTTRTHYTVLWHEWGPEKLKAWHESLYQRNINESYGNAGTRSLVGEGVCDLGFTDTDDYFVGKQRRKNVAMVPVRTPSNKVICIPNTISLIHGSQRPEEARKLIDFILSAETELALAKSKAFQIPLGPVNESQLPQEVKDLMPLTKEAVDLTKLRQASKPCLNWLKEIYGE
jgi:iron(III) transport system substrate-binding protein